MLSQNQNGGWGGGRKSLEKNSGPISCQAKSGVISNLAGGGGGGSKNKSCSEWWQTCSRFGIFEIR